MSLFDLVSEFLQPFLDAFPRFCRRPASYEFLVCDSPINGACVRYWPVLHSPLVTHVEYYPRFEHAIDCGIQKLETAKDQAVVVNATMRVTIFDPIQLRMKAGHESWEETVSMIARSYVCDAVAETDGPIDIAAVKKTMEAELAYLGIEVVAFKIEDFQKVLAISITS